MNKKEQSEGVKRKELRRAVMSGRGLEMSSAHKVNYRKFLESLKKGFEVVSLKDHHKKTNKKLCLLRHDVDYALNCALQMAEIEHDMGVHSTYYILHTAKYYRKRNDVIELCKKIQAMGHEIGLHNNILTVCLTNPKNPKPETLLQRELTFFRSNGIKIYGSSSHGSRWCRILNYINYETFKKCVCPWKKIKNKIGGSKTDPSTNIVNLHTIRLEDFELSYEAYFLPIDYYLSDTGSKWRAIDVSIHDEWHIRFLKQPLVENINVFVEELGRKKDVKIIQVLTHPIYWTRPKSKP